MKVPPRPLIRAVGQPETRLDESVYGTAGRVAQKPHGNVGRCVHWPSYKRCAPMWCRASAPDFIAIPQISQMTSAGDTALLEVRFKPGVSSSVPARIKSSMPELSAYGTCPVPQAGRVGSLLQEGPFISSKTSSSSTDNFHMDRPVLSLTTSGLRQKQAIAGTVTLAKNRCFPKSNESSESSTDGTMIFATTVARESHSYFMDIASKLLSLPMANGSGTMTTHVVPTAHFAMRSSGSVFACTPAARSDSKSAGSATEPAHVPAFSLFMTRRMRSAAFVPTRENMSFTARSSDILLRVS